MKKLIDRGSSGSEGWHSIVDYIDCPRKGRFSEDHVREEEEHYHYRGHLLHVGLAHLYARRMKDGRSKYLEPLDAVQAYAEKHPSPHRDRWLEPVLRCLPHYEAYWGDERKYEVLGVEKVLRMFVKDGMRRLPFTARYDLMVKNRRTHRVEIWDHKGTYAVLPKVVESYALSGQLLGLERIGRAKYGKRWGGVKLNFVRLPEDPNKEPEFGRPPLKVSPLAVRNFTTTVKYAHSLRDRFHDLPTEEVPGSYNDMCWGKYGKCIFRWHCHRGGD